MAFPYLLQVSCHIIVVTLAAVLVTPIWDIFRDLVPIECAAFALCEWPDVVND